MSAGDHDNGAINWTQIAAAGYAFVAIKVTEGRYYVNPHYKKDAAAAAAAGLYVTAYHFANPRDSTGVHQAEYAVAKAGHYKVGGRYLPLVLDLEYDPYSSNECYGLTVAQMLTWVSGFMSEAKALTGASPIIYTPRIWWNDCTGNSRAYGSDVLWVPAYYGGTPGALPAGWGSWTMWQYTEGGRAPGIAGTVDKDFFTGGPQAEQTAQSAAVSIPIETLNALTGQHVTYTAAGLPPGVTMSTGGQITGAPTTAGTYKVTVTPHGTGTILPSNMSFTWGVSAPPAVALAALGSDGQVLAQAPQLGSGWHPLGGKFTTAPAVAAIPNPNSSTPAEPLFIGTASNQELYVRSAIAGWQLLGTVKCVGAPAAAFSGTTLTVACRGTDNALWYNTTTWSGTGLPTFTAAWRSLGGILSASPAVAPVGGSMWFFVRGTTGAIFTRTLSTSYAHTKWACSGPPAAGLEAATGYTVFACNVKGKLYEAVHRPAGWSPAKSQGGSITGGVGVAATSQQIEVLAESTDGTVWIRTPGGVSSLSGKITGGVGAAPLN